MAKLTEENIKQFLEKHSTTGEVIEKLAEYERLEEQGLLVKIECHCKDCKHVDFAGCNNGACYCYMNECYMNEDDFCKYAERYKEEAEKKLESMKGE